MAEIKRSDPYVLPQTQGRYVTEVVDSKNYTIVEISNVDTALAYSVDGVLSTSSSASDNFKNNLAQGTYNSTINNSINKTLGITSNTQNPNQPGTPGTSTPTSPPNQNPKADSAVLKYPLTMDDLQDRIMFHAHEYKSGGRLTGGNFGDLNPVQYNPVDQRVYLPIQSSITDQNAVGWEPDTLNPIEVEAAKLSMNLMTVNTANSDIGTEAGKILNNALARAKTGSKVEGANQAIRTYLVGQAVGVNNLLSRLEGQVLNPNLEPLFQGPQLRPFSFSFKLSPRSKEEAVRVKEIIRYFKKNMAVKKGNAIFLSAPNVFKIQYQYGSAGKVHQSLNLIKMCALTNCSVDYTPNGTYMTYSDPEATMISYSISLSFQELTPIYDTDYTTFDYGDGTTVSIPTQNSIGA